MRRERRTMPLQVAAFGRIENSEMTSESTRASRRNGFVQTDSWVISCGRGCLGRSVDLGGHGWVPVEVVVDVQRVEVRLAELDLPTFGLPLELLKLVGALALAHEVEVVAGVFLAHERPVRVVVAERRGDEEPPGKLDEQRDVLPRLEVLSPAHFDTGVADDLVRDAFPDRDHKLRFSDRLVLVRALEELGRPAVVARRGVDDS